MLAAAMVLAVAVAVGCGDDDEGGGTSDPPATSAAAPLALTDRVCEIPGLVPAPPPATPVASVDEFAALGSQSVEDTAAFAAAYREYGFEEGLYQQMQPDGQGSTGGLCIVIRFADAAGASADVGFEVAQQEAFAQDDGLPFAPFDVPGVPGAQGFQRGPDDGSHGHNIVFADGRHTYFLGLGAEHPSPTQRADAIAAAQALYQRVQGR
jgi:hypothetical protein